MPEIRVKSGGKDEHTRIRENARKMTEEHNRKCIEQSDKPQRAELQKAAENK